jgi:polysaccharide biosynthesis transport protein
MEHKVQIVKSSNVPSVIPTTPEWSGLWQGGQPSQAYRGDAEVRYLSVIRRHGRTILLVMLFCLATALLVTFLLNPTYKAKSMVEVLAVNGEFMNSKDIDPNASSSSMDTYVETQTKLLTSESVADRVVANLLPKADQYNLQEKGGWAQMRHWFGWQAAPESLETAIRKTIASLKVKAEGQSSLISITVIGPSPQIAADTANAIANQHIAALQDARWSTATQTAEFLSVQLDGLRKKLQASENELQDYARTKGLIYTSDVSRESVASEKLRAIQADLQKSESDRADKQAQLELLTSSSPEALPKVLDDSSLRENQSRLIDLRRQLADLNATLMPNHYKVKEVQSQIAELEKQSGLGRSAVMARIKNDFRAAERREQLQRKAYLDQLALVSDQSGKEIRYNMLKREVDANRELYQSMSQKIREASVVAALRASNIRMVDPAKLPSTPYQPNILINTGIGLLAGCMFSVLAVLLRERGDQSIRAPGESSRLLQIPELAIIPSASRDIRTQIVSGSNMAAPRLTRASKLLTAQSDTSKDLLRSCVQNSSLVAESFRSAVTSILLWGRDKALAHQVLVVTSAHSGAGKTTSVLNLGLGLAESGRRVLLVDGDLRLPRLGKIFGFEAVRGLSNVLSEALPPSRARELIRETAVSNLYIMPSGPRQANAPQMLHSKALEAWLDEVRTEYDFILIDSPPAIPLTDVRLLAQHADGVILVFRSGETSAEQSLTVRRYFTQDGTYVFGSILNDWNASSENPAYFNSYTKYSQPFAD